MSFATECKNEACKVLLDDPKAKMAELEAYLRLSSEIVRTSNGFEINYITKNTNIIRRFSTLIKEIYNISPELYTKENNRFDKKTILIANINEHSEEIIEEYSLFQESPNYEEYENDDKLKYSYLRGAFISKGSVSDPNKNDYHLEITTTQEREAVYIQRLMNTMDLNAKISKRRNDLVIYIKEIEKIIDFLRIIGVAKMVFLFEEVQIKKEFANNINRKINSEIANEIKTMNAAKQQLSYIQFLEYNYPLEQLDPKILLVMKVRKDNPEASFKELLEIINNNYEEHLTKSGLNHRFIKIKELALNLKETMKK